MYVFDFMLYSDSWCDSVVAFYNVIHVRLSLVSRKRNKKILEGYVGRLIRCNSFVCFDNIKYRSRVIWLIKWVISKNFNTKVVPSSQMVTARLQSATLLILKGSNWKEYNDDGTLV